MEIHRKLKLFSGLLESHLKENRKKKLFSKRANDVEINKNFKTFYCQLSSTVPCQFQEGILYLSGLL